MVVNIPQLYKLNCPLFIDSFSISDPYSGTIRVTGTLNVEVKAQYNLTVQATDDGKQVNEPSLSSTVSL